MRRRRGRVERELEREFGGKRCRGGRDTGKASERESEKEREEREREKERDKEREKREREKEREWSVAHFFFSSGKIIGGEILDARAHEQSDNAFSCTLAAQWEEKAPAKDAPGSERSFFSLFFTNDVLSRPPPKKKKTPPQ